MAKLTKGQIEKSIREHMSKRSLTEHHFVDLRNQYLELFDIKEKLVANIDELGVQYAEKLANGTTVIKDNKSVDKLLKVNQQMIKILEYLQINPSEIMSEEDEEL